ncbi:MAG: Do family serine endopeptidase, partial [Gemmatimonadetes bacterium]|nr:Do family serine endopeptidase [Gemmatimonadota bacterium]
DIFRNHPFVQPRRPEGQIREGLGSGVIVSADGYIITNNHVVATGRQRNDVADRIIIDLADRRSFEAKVVGRDPLTDLAVLKIDVDVDLPYLTLDDSDDLDVGEWVLAIGNPFGQLHTVTTGIVSAVGRSAQLSVIEDYIQTDAAINPGNSGGALVDTRGGLVGINTAIVSHSGGSQGIGFAIPSNLVKTIMEQLVEFGEVRRGMLGVFPDDIDIDMAAALGLERHEGALVEQVVEDSPAQEAGIEPLDVIIDVDGEPIAGAGALRAYVARNRPGTEVRVRLIREGRERTVTVTLAARPEKTAAATSETEQDERLGLRVRSLTDDVAERYGFEDETGVIISRVSRGSRAAHAGLQSADLIVEVNRVPIASLEDYEDALEGATGTALLMIRRATRGGIATDVVALRLPD